MAAQSDTRILIIGAGITGLALAQGLKKAGIAFAIYERAPSVASSKRNWDFGLHWGIDALKALVPAHFLATLDDCQVDPHIDLEEKHFRMPLLNAANGEVIKTLESSKFYRLRRDKFRKWLLQDLDVQFGEDIVGIDYGDNQVTVTFSDGSRDTESLVVGCDGAQSTVRSLLLGPDQAALSSVGNFATAMIYTKHTREHALALREPPFHPLYQVGVHPAGHACILAVHDAEDEAHPENWSFFHYISYDAPSGHENWSKRQLIAYQKQLAKDFGEPWNSAYEWLSDDEERVWLTTLRDWDPRLSEHKWDNHNGRVTLAGDAAHPMSFQRGQGLNNAIQDAYELCKAISTFSNDGGHQAVAIDTYENEMIERGGKEVELSHANTFLLHSNSGEHSHLAKQGMARVKS